MRSSFRVREVAERVPQRRVQRLQMQWMRIVDSTGNLSRSQVLLQRVALLASNGVLVVDVFEALWLERRHDAGNLLQETRVFGGI